jgi:hypothetical protein
MKNYFESFIFADRAPGYDPQHTPLKLSYFTNFSTVKDFINKLNFMLDEPWSMTP